MLSSVQKEPIIEPCDDSMSPQPNNIQDNDSEHETAEFSKNRLAGLRFTSFDHGLEPFVKEISQKQGFVLARDTHKMNSKRAVEIFGRDNEIQRGNLYCRCGATSQARCCFTIPFTFCFKSKEYIVN